MSVIACAVRQKRSAEKLSKLSLMPRKLKGKLLKGPKKRLSGSRSKLKKNCKRLRNELDSRPSAMQRTRQTRTKRKGKQLRRLASRLKKKHVLPPKQLV